MPPASAPTPYETTEGGAPHLVYADASGNVLSDVPESSLPAAQAQAIAALKQQLPGLLPPHVLSDAERDQVLGEVTSIIGHTLAAGVRTDTYEATEGGTPHLVYADASGLVLSDAQESSLPAARAQAIAALKQQLPGLLPPHVLSDAERDQVLGELTSITGHTRSGERPAGTRPLWYVAGVVLFLIVPRHSLYLMRTSIRPV